MDVHVVQSTIGISSYCVCYFRFTSRRLFSYQNTFSVNFTCGTADFPSLPLEVIILWLWSLISLVLAVHAAKITFIIQPQDYPTDNLAGERFCEWLQMSVFFKILKTMLGAGQQLYTLLHLTTDHRGIVYWKVYCIDPANVQMTKTMVNVFRNS